MTTPQISVIIPVYNAELYLRECVESILNQNFPSLEVLLIDDGSKDGSPQLCDQLAAENAQVYTIHQENGGVSRARNRGIEEAKGEYITFVDADDYFLPGALHKMWSFVEAHPGVDIVSSSIEMDGKTIGPANASLSFSDDVTFLRNSTTYELFSFFPYSKLFRRDFLDQWNVRFIVGIVVGEDTLFSYFAQKHVQSVAICHEATYFYRQNENSVMHEKDFTRHGVAMYQVARIVAKNMDEKGLYGQTRFLLDRLSVDYVVRLNRPGRTADMHVIRQELRKTYQTIKALPIPFCVKLAAWRLTLPLSIACNSCVDFFVRGLTWLDLKRVQWVALRCKR